MWKRAISSGASFACFSFLTSFMCFFSYFILFLLSSPPHHDFILLVSRLPLDFQSYFSSLASLCSAFRHRPLSTTHPLSLPPSFSSSPSLSTVEFTRPPPVSHLSLKATPDKPSQTPRLSLLAPTRLWWHWRTYLSRLCFLPLFFFFSRWVGEELPNLLTERRGDVRMSWLQDEPQIAAKCRLFTHRGTALQRDDCWQRCHPVIAENSFPHLLPPPQGFYILLHVLFYAPSSPLFLHYKVFSCPPLDLVSRISKAGFRNRPCSAPPPSPQSSCLIRGAFKNAKRGEIEPLCKRKLCPLTDFFCGRISSSSFS